MRKFILLLFSLVLVTVNTGFSTPSMNQIEKNILEKMSDQQLEFFKEFKENGGEITQLTKDEEKEIKNAIMEEKKLQDFHDQQLKNYKSINLPSENSSFKVSDDGGTNYLLFQAYEYENNYIVTVSTYDAEKGKLNTFTAQKRTINNDKKNTKNEIDTEELIQYTNSDSDVNTLAKSWEWNGKTFACGMTGLLACIQFCGVWAMVNPGIGIACDIVCNTAMIIACM